MSRLEKVLLAAVLVVCCLLVLGISLYQIKSCADRGGVPKDGGSTCLNPAALK